MFPNLMAEMSRAGITAEKLARAININPATMSAKLNKKARIKLAEAAAIRDAFFPQLAIDYLFSETALDPIYMNRPA